LIDITTANYIIEPGDTADGIYQIDGQNPFTFIKMDNHAVNTSYYSYIRFNNMNQQNGANFLVSCFYF